MKAGTAYANTWNTPHGWNGVGRGETEAQEGGVGGQISSVHHWTRPPTCSGQCQKKAGQTKEGEWGDGAKAGSTVTGQRSPSHTSDQTVRAPVTSRSDSEERRNGRNTYGTNRAESGTGGEGEGVSCPVFSPTTEVQDLKHQVNRHHSMETWAGGGDSWRH